MEMFYMLTLSISVPLLRHCCIILQDAAIGGKQIKYKYSLSITSYNALGITNYLKIKYLIQKVSLEGVVKYG